LGGRWWGSLKDGLWEVRSSLPSQRIARLILCPGETENEGGYEMKKRNKHIGSSLEDFLKEEGVLEETRAVVLKETLAWQVQQAMKKEKISKVEMARRMNTSRAALDRLLDPGNASVTLQTLTRAAHAVGRDLRIELV
jgi:antitoxin HicB